MSDTLRDRRKRMRAMMESDVEWSDEAVEAILWRCHRDLYRKRIADLEKEVARLSGRETLAGFLTTTLRKAAEGTPLEFPRTPWPEECWVKTTIMPPVQGPKKCGCGACQFKDGKWRHRGEVRWPGNLWKYCPECGEELKA